MKGKVLRVLGLAVLLLGTALFTCAQTKLTILHTNDTHSAMLPFGTQREPRGVDALASRIKNGPIIRPAAMAEPQPAWGGIARMAGLIKKLKASAGDALVLNAGDVFVGSFEFNKYLGYPELKIMEGLYDAMELGNHEFDLGLDALTGILSGALAGDAPVALPIICANINLDGTLLKDMVRPSIIRTINGVKVGIFGLVNQEPQSYSPEIAARFAPDLLAVAGTQAALLRAEGCEVVVCLSHLGTMYDTQMLPYVPGIDIVIGGHTHDAFSGPVVANGKIIVQAGDFGKYLGELNVTVGNGGVSLESWKLHRVDGSLPEDPLVRARLNVVRDGIVEDPRFGPVYTQFIAAASQEIPKGWPKTGQNRDSALGNLVTDAIRTGLANAGFLSDLAMEPLGYMAAGISAGKVVGNDILRAVPYGYDPQSGLGFKVVIVPMPGSLILGGLEYTTSWVQYTSDLVMQVSGLTYAYDSSKPAAPFGAPPNRLDVMSVMAGEELVAANTDKVYMVAMTEQVFNVLNSLTAPLGMPLQKIDTGLFEYNLVRDYMKALRTVSYASSGRVKDTAAAAALTRIRR